MRIELKDIGTLHKADFEVGDLTLICGENNTGKTYAAYSLYGYLDFMRSVADSLTYNLLRSKIDLFRLTHIFGDREEQEGQRYAYETIEKDLKDHFYKKTGLYSTELSRAMAGRDEDFLNAKFMAHQNFSLEGIKEATKATKIYTNTPMDQCGIKHIFDRDGLKIIIPKRLRSKEYQPVVLDTLLTITMPKPFILSVERTGVSIFQAELDFIKAAKLDTITQMFQENQAKHDIFGLFEIQDRADRRKQIYPKPVRDNIDFIRDVREKSTKSSIFKQDKERYKSILDLRDKLVMGRYKITDQGVLFQPKGSKSAYALEIASSSARSLFMLDRYILHVAQKNDILMIDEPELNLHPNNQILVARLLALLVNAGIKVFITTHSDYIVRELSNCIMLKNLNATQIENLKKQGYTQEHSLDAHRVKAYVTKTTKKQNTLTPVKITQEQGIFMQTFDDPIKTQNENQSLIAEKVFQNLRNNHDS
ncbi:AAA family ATPase [Helicobacter bizzozeronii]|uniref:AAA family ATPase n=1 Tax=Helicobacter bizzozeronii TaxID=56877 RepID=UPI000CEF440D|nr:AAA family ATPase [Helicobacter bizzozeronii]